jgi:hypothetical protein
LIARHQTDPRIDRRHGLPAVLACAASIALFAGCTPDGTAAKPRPPEVRLDDVSFRAWRGAELAASGTAASATYHRDTGTVVAEEARVTIPRPGEPGLEATAPVLRGDVKARTWNGEGGVLLTRGDVEARTPSARFSEGDGQVRGDEPVVVSGPGWRLSGPAFTADPRSGDVDIRGGVRLRADGVRP